MHQVVWKFYQPVQESEKNLGKNCIDRVGSTFLNIRNERDIERERERERN
jgi:hypothetical protein